MIYNYQINNIIKHLIIDTLTDENKPSMTIAFIGFCCALVVTDLFSIGQLILSLREGFVLVGLYGVYVL